MDIRIPDIGDFADVPVIEVHVAAGDTVAAEDPLVTLESDKATMDIPAPAAGTVSEVLLQVGDRVSAGDLVLRLESSASEMAPAREHVSEEAEPEPAEPAGYGSPSGVYEVIEVAVPDLGDFADVPVIEVHVAPGDSVAVEDPLITLESDKATMDIPAPMAGTVTGVRVSVGDRVSAGHLIADLRTGETTVPEATVPEAAVPAAAVAPAAAAGVAPAASVAPGDLTTEVLVLGAGPGGYTAAFRAADLGKKVVLVDSGAALGGVCLNVGCIPSKALLHAAKVIAETKEMSEHGVTFGAPAIDVDKLRAWKDGVVGRLTGGLAGLARQRKVTTIRGYGRFSSPHQVRVERAEGGSTAVDFEQAIIAAGSEPLALPFIPADDQRVIDSTGALEMAVVPERLLVLGGGIIGLEMATVYHELGARITIVELMDQLIPGADKDLINPLAKRVGRLYENIYLKTRVTDVQARPEGLVVSFDGPKAPATDTFDRILVAVGRRPNGQLIGAENAGVTVDERGFIAVDKQLRTNVPHIYAIGDVIGQPMLAHKAMHEAKVAAEVIAGKPSSFDARVIPSVAYTDPEVAWAGTTETEARAAGVTYGKGVFPWAASGRSLSLGRSEGLTKVLFDEASGRVIGCGIVGPSAGDLIAETALAIEMGADAADIGLTIHPHPTLSETVAMAAEAFEGTITDLYLPQR
ncbi:MAG: dihydrolipoyl dehydrogenase [Streptosporangiaceae bacterium]